MSGTTAEEVDPVGVVPPYHFTSQSIFAIDNEPLAICLADDKLLVATMGHYVEVRNLESPCQADDLQPVTHTFCTVDLVKQMLYSECGSYVATLEVKTSRQSLMTRVRTYLNWQIDTKGLPMRARIAGRVTPSSQCSIHMGLLEMVELPLQKQACFIACCKSTGNLAVSCGCSVSIAFLRVKVHDISKLKFHDWDHLMEIYLSFLIKEVAICEEYLACMSANEVHVLQIRQRCSSEQNITSALLSTDPISPPTVPHTSQLPVEQIGIDAAEARDDEYFISWNDSSPAGCHDLESNCPHNPALNPLKDKLHPASWPLTVHLPSLSQQSIYVDQSNHSTEYIGPMSFFPGYPVKLECGGDPLNIGSQSPLAHHFDTVSFLYRKFPVPLPNNSNQQFCLHSLQFLPFYLPGDNCNLPSSACCNVSINPFHSNRRQHLKRLEVMFSGQRNAFLYNILGTVKLVSEFTFFIDTHYVALENSIFYAATLAGITTYSVGKWQRTLQFFEHYNSESAICDFPQQQTVALGVHPFINVHLVACGNGQLVLLANHADDSISKDCNSGWTVYALRCPTPEEFYHGLLKYSKESCVVEMPGDVGTHFLYEAHSSLAAEILIHRPPPSSQLAISFRDVCCYLADHHLTTSDGDLADALFFYSMSGLEIQSIASIILSTKSDIYAPDVFKERIVDILSRIFMHNSLGKLQILSEQVAGDVLEALAPTSKFPLVFLKGCLSGYNPDKAISHFKKRLQTPERCSGEDVVAICLLFAQMGMTSELCNYLKLISTESLLEIAVTYPAVWLTQPEPELMCSPLFQAFQKVKPVVFVQILLQFLGCGLLSSNLISLLCKADWEEFGLSPRTDKLLSLFLEEYLAGAKVVSDDCCEAVVTLSSLYLKVLANPHPKNRLESRVKPWNHFGARATWLDSLPPFLGHSVLDCCVKSNDEGDELAGTEFHCWCTKCNDCLLRFQSLLCSVLASQEVKSSVALSISAAPMLRGALSLQMLCSSPVGGARLLIEHRKMSVFMEYCIDKIGENSSQWIQLLVLLMDKAESEDINDVDRAIVSTLLDGVVVQLSELVSPVELITSLPMDHEGRFMAQVQRCITRHQATNLWNIIIAKGQELKSIV